MRLFSAIIVSGVLLTTNAAWSVPRDDAPQERNPIEWLLSDLGSLFRTAVSALDQPPTDEALAKNETKTTVASFSNMDSDADLFGEGNFEPILSQETSAKNQDSKTGSTKSIGGLFENLLAFLKQNAQSNSETSNVYDERIVALDDPKIKTTNEVALLQKDEAVSLTEITPETENNSVVDFFAVLDNAAKAYKNDDNIEPAQNAKPALNGFFASLGNIFTGLSSDTHSTQVAANPPSQGIDTTALTQDNTDVAVLKALIKPTEEKTVIADTTSFEPAPWQLFPHVAVFVPEADLFDGSKVSLPPLEAIKPQKIESVEVTESVIEIRKRTAQNPVARNHLSLGRTKTAAFPDEDPGFLSHLIDTFVGENDSTATQTEVLANKIPDRLIPEEQLDLGYTAPDVAVKTGPQDELTTIGDGILKNIDLYLGADTVIGRPYQPNAHQSGACIERSLQVSIFCVTDIEWPAEVASSFAQDTAFTLPGEGVVRYENGSISRVYTPFKANDFAKVVKFMQRRFGPPLEREIVWMHMIEAPKMPNTTFRWRAVSADRKDSVVLEVRNFDDLRRSFADLNRGMVRLYRDGSRPIFKHLSTMDLMLIQRRRVSQGPTAPSNDTAAN